MKANKILFPTDFSQSSVEGLAYATSLARECDAKLLIVHVEHAGETYEGPYYGPSEELQSNLRAQLENTVPDDRSVSYEQRYEKGSPAKTICDLAESENVDLIVIPTHGRRGISHLLMGSVAEAVVRRAPCPVLTVRPSVIGPETPQQRWPHLQSLSRDEIREVDRRAIEDMEMPGSILMENAGRGTADLMERLGIDGPVVVVAGRGNNGGDGFVVARHLDYRGYAVRVLLLAESSMLHGDAEINWKIIKNASIPCRELGDTPDVTEVEQLVGQSAWTIDGILGTGARGEIEEPLASVIQCLNRSAQRIVAIDVPSGLDCDTGEPLGPCIRAAHTVTFVARKKGFDAPGAAQYTGQVHVADIGVPRALLEPYRIEGEMNT